MLNLLIQSKHQQSALLQMQIKMFGGWLFRLDIKWLRISVCRRWKMLLRPLRTSCGTHPFERRSKERSGEHTSPTLICRRFLMLFETNERVLETRSLE